MDTVASIPAHRTVVTSRTTGVLELRFTPRELGMADEPSVVIDRRTKERGLEEAAERFVKVVRDDY